MHHASPESIFSYPQSARIIVKPTFTTVNYIILQMLKLSHTLQDFL